MDTHYNWSDPEFRDEFGESLKLVVNAVADVLHDMKHRDRLVLNIMAMLTLTAMKRYDPRGGLTRSLLTPNSV